MHTSIIICVVLIAKFNYNNIVYGGFMPKKVTFNPKHLSALAQEIKDVADVFYYKLGRYGGHTRMAEWLIKNGHQEGSITHVAKKVSNILCGCVRGLHPNMRMGGVWRAEEAERIIALIGYWLMPIDNPPITEGIWTRFDGCNMDEDKRNDMRRACEMHGLDWKGMPECLCYVKLTPATKKRDFL